MMAGRLVPSRPSARRGGRRAFTFIETLATLSLLAIVLPAVMSGISLSLATAALARQQAQASSLAYEKLMELVVEEQWLHESSVGDFGPDLPEYRWTVRVSDWDSLLQQVDVTVSWLHQGRERSVTLSTLVQSGGEG